MEQSGNLQNFITNIFIENVRHLKDIHIPLSETERKHLILTGKNGSGKTSVLEAMDRYLSMYPEEITYEKLMQYITSCEHLINSNQEENEQQRHEKINLERCLEGYKSDLNKYTSGIKLNFKKKYEFDIVEAYKTGYFIFGYYAAHRNYRAEEPIHIEKVNLNNNYRTDEKPNTKLIKYLLDLKTMQLFAQNEGEHNEAKRINDWFINFENLLKDIFNDMQLELVFDYKSYAFTISTTGREPFSFNEMSSGYSAMLDIVVDLMLRMENKVKEIYGIQGIVLIDEIETHLHIDLQKKIMPFLTSVFPNIQFIVTTHSPFVISSAENCVIYDLENNTLVTDDMLKDYTLSGIIKGYFGADTLSAELRNRFERYKVLVNKHELTDDDYAELADLEYYLDELPDYLSLEFSSEYQRLKLEMENRG